MGTLIGLLFVPSFVAAIGLSKIGPVAGGGFAWFQSMGFLHANSLLSFLQSAAMGGQPIALICLMFGFALIGASIGFAWSYSRPH